jgi:hypothetical protein
MRILRCLAEASLLSGVIAFPSPRDLIQTRSPQPEPYGPPTRADRLAEGWVDENAKYFHEPGHDDILGHYDTRFFHGIVSYEERSDTLHHMIRAYLDFFRNNGLETWIAHGTLLGWWWNGKVGYLGCRSTRSRANRPLDSPVGLGC